MNKQELLIKFLNEQKLLTIATIDNNNLPWISTVYFGNDEHPNFYIITDPSSKHGQHFIKSPIIAFSCAWHDSKDLNHRKGIQAKGNIELLMSDAELDSFQKYYFNDKMNIFDTDYLEEVKSNSTPFRFWKIKPSFIKYWSDEDFGEEGVAEFTSFN